MKPTSQTSLLAILAALLAACLFILAPFSQGQALPSRAHAQASFEYTVFLPFTIQSGESPQGSTQPGWLAYLNEVRAQAGLAAVTENPTWSNGAYKHSKYIVKNDILEHTEDSHRPFYSPEGLAAAQTSNLMASEDLNASDEYAIDAWMQAPFHAVGILDPRLGRVGFGSYREQDGHLQMGASLDVLRGLGNLPGEVSFPVMWPGDGATVSLSLHWGEYPDPLSGCPGYTSPAGLPVIIQAGPGNLNPQVTAHSFELDGQPLEHCVFTETSYQNPDAAQQSLGRLILDSRDAIVLIPRNPLASGNRYTVSITINGAAYTWSFNVSQPAP